jgi:hypothetical protein
LDLSGHMEDIGTRIDNTVQSPLRSELYYKYAYKIAIWGWLIRSWEMRKASLPKDERK